MIPKFLSFFKIFVFKNKDEFNDPTSDAKSRIPKSHPMGMDMSAAELIEIPF